MSRHGLVVPLMIIASTSLVILHFPLQAWAGEGEQFMRQLERISCRLNREILRPRSFLGISTKPVRVFNRISQGRPSGIGRRQNRGMPSRSTSSGTCTTSGKAFPRTISSHTCGLIWLPRVESKCKGDQEADRKQNECCRNRRCQAEVRGMETEEEVSRFYSGFIGVSF